jgi:hypothetical protein
MRLKSQEDQIMVLFCSQSGTPIVMQTRFRKKMSAWVTVDHGHCFRPHSSFHGSRPY